MNFFKNLIVLTFTALMMNVSFAECLSWAGNPVVNTSDGVTYIDFQSYPHWADGSPSVSVTLDDGSQASSSGQNANQGNNAFWYAGFTADQLASDGDNTYTVTFSSSSDSGCSDFSFTGTFYTDCLGVYNGTTQCFAPQSTSELQSAVNLWVSNESQALSNYGDINTWDVSSITCLLYTSPSPRD